MKKGKKTEAIQPGQFDNPITLTILLVIIGLGLVGLWKCYSSETWSGLFWGIVCVTTSGMLWVFGLVEHSPKQPIEGGMITIWDRPFLLFGNYIVVGGKVPLLPFFPFFIDTMKFALDDQNYLFEGDDFFFQTKDNVSVKINISVTAMADIDDLLDYRQSGASMEAIMDQFREIFFSKTQTIVKGMDAIQVKTEGEKVSKRLLTDVFEGKSIGLTIKRVQIIPFLPKGLEEKMLRVLEETYQRISETKDYGTLTIGAQAMQIAAAKQFILNMDTLSPEERAQAILNLLNEKKILTLDEYTERIMSAKVIEQGNTTGIQGGGKVTPVVVPATGGNK